MRRLRNPWFKLGVVVLFLGIVFLILRQLNIDFSQITTEGFKRKINSYGIWGPIIYIIFYLLRPLILFPAAILSASAGVIWGLKGFIYLQIAANISAILEFLIARYFARGAIKNFIRGKMLDIDEAIEKHGFITVLLIRLIPNVAWDIQNLSLGLTKVKFRDYFLATFIGIMPGSFALVYFGSSIINVLINPKNFWMIILAVLFLIGVYFLQKYLRKKHGYRIKRRSSNINR
jgi:uncharacterized membrane protein YdjX (TVP38/TMEM64 family)